MVKYESNKYHFKIINYSYITDYNTWQKVQWITEHVELSKEETEDESDMDEDEGA